MRKEFKRKRGDIDIFRGFYFEDNNSVFLGPRYSTGRDANSDVSFLLQPMYMNWFTLNPKVATIFAIDPKNQRLHDNRVSRVLWDHQNESIDTYIYMHFRDAHAKMPSNDFGLIIRASLPQEAQLETYEHLLEQEVNSKSSVKPTHIGVIKKETMHVRWMPVGWIPKRYFSKAKALAEYIYSKGKRRKWKGSKTPKFLVWAIEDVGNYEPDSPYREIIDRRDDIRTLLSIFDYYEK